MQNAPVFPQSCLAVICTQNNGCRDLAAASTRVRAPYALTCVCVRVHVWIQAHQNLTHSPRLACLATRADHAPHLTLETGTGRVVCCVWAPNSKTIMGGCNDGSVLIWSTSSGSVLSALSGGLCYVSDAGGTGRKAWLQGLVTECKSELTNQHVYS